MAFEIASIHVIPLFKSETIGPGDYITSDAVDLRDKAQQGIFSLAYFVEVGTNGTAGTVIWSYVGSSLEGGTYLAPSASVAIGTNGTGGTAYADIKTFEPEPMPFIKIRGTTTGIAGTGNSVKVTAELIVQ